VATASPPPADLPATLATTIQGSPGTRTLAIKATLPESAATPGGLVTFLARVKNGNGRVIALVSH